MKYLTRLNRALKNGSDGKFYVIYILPQFKIKSKKGHISPLVVQAVAVLAAAGAGHKRPEDPQNPKTSTSAS